MKPFSSFQLGKLTLPNPIFYAPLAGCSDFPFRQMSAKYSPGLMYCEMVKMDALVRHDPNTFRMLDFEKGMHPIGGQICGSKPQLAGKAAKLLEELGFDVVDLNCGCPVDKVTKDGSGSGLLKNPLLIGEILAEMVAAVKIPVTVKIRAGWDEENTCVEELTQIAEQAGAQAITVHGRTRQQAYRGPANWDYIKASKRVAKNIKVVGNGDVMDPLSAKRMFEYTGCDAVLVARGTLGQPWIAQDILAYLRGEQLPVRTSEDCRQALYAHFVCAENYYNARQVVIEMRRVGCWYIKSSTGTREFRGLISRASSPEEVHSLIQTFPFDQQNDAINLKPSSSEGCSLI